MTKMIRQILAVVFNVFAFNCLAFILGLSFGLFDMGMVGGLVACTIVILGMAFATDDKTLEAFKTIAHMD